MRKSECRYCQQPVVFARTARGKMMPLDVTPNPNGNVACYRDVSGQMVGHVVSETDLALPFERLYMPHFATCKQLPKPDKPSPPPANVVPISRGATLRASRQQPGLWGEQ